MSCTSSALVLETYAFTDENTPLAMTLNYCSTLQEVDMTSLEAQTGPENTDRSPSAIDAEKPHVELVKERLNSSEETTNTLSKIDGSVVTEAIVQMARAVEGISSKLRPPPSTYVFISLSIMCLYPFLEFRSI